MSETDDLDGSHRSVTADLALPFTDRSSSMTSGFGGFRAISRGVRGLH